MASDGSAGAAAHNRGPETIASSTMRQPPSVRQSAGRHAGTRETGRAEFLRRQSEAHRHAGFARIAGFIRQPLTLICAVQTIGCLFLVRSNTAFTDEAAYLRLGDLLIAHWLHGKSWPAAYAGKVLSGSPVIYPPLGALANSAGGLIGARVLSLAFMVAATILVYRTASRLLGRAEAVIAAALFGLSEPVFRLAFATYDAMSVFLVAFAAWLAVEAGYARRRRTVVLCSGAALGMSVAVAYSAIAVAPVVIAFAFLNWWQRFDSRLARSWTIIMTGTATAVFALVMTAGASWSGIVFSVFNRQVDDHQEMSLIFREAARFTGLIIVLALIGAAAAIREPDRRSRLLLILLGLTALVVPAEQIYQSTAWSLDKHVAYGIWFASIAVAYGCMALARLLRAAGIRSRIVVVAAGLTALVIVVAANWQIASGTFRGWANSTSFVSSFERVAPRNHGLIFSSAQKRVAQYYAPEGEQWWLWKVDPMSLDPPGVPRDRLYAYFAHRLRTAGYGLIALFYDRPAGMALPAGPSVAPADAAHIAAQLGDLEPLKPNEPGVPVLTRALANDPDFRLVAVGPYDSSRKNGIYAIWLSQPQPPAGDA